MERIDFLQDALAESAKNLLNAHSNLVNTAELILDMKKKLIEKKVIGNTYLVSEICNHNSWEYKYRNPDAEMKALAVTCCTYNEHALGTIRQEEYYKVPFANISIWFMQDPQKLLDSKVKYTDAEKAILKKMLLEYKTTPDYVNTKLLYDLSNNLHGLKHNLHILDTATWEYSFYQLISSDFLTKGMSCNSTQIFSS